MAVALYLAVAATCLVAALGARSRPDGLRDSALWLGIAAMFVLLAASRGLGLENWVQETLRSLLQRQGEYGSRRAIQGPIAAAVLAAGGIGVIVLMLRSQPARLSRRATCLRGAMRAAAAMLGLVALRIVSFHPTDALLYEAKLNWVLDIGLSLAVGGAALIYSRPSPSLRPSTPR